eukprot:GCRY01000674.1.p1 GENE.GCRY01000674.1~~GCRY01000674.1.p1  ORF type:complete len:220 (+),score=19.24 GCRY01000674.1:152-811(+)
MTSRSSFLLTSITRVHDLLVLVEDSQSESSHSSIKNDLRDIIVRLKRECNNENKITVDSEEVSIHVLMSDNVCYLTMTPISFPKMLAFLYLDDLAKEFDMQFGNIVEKQTRPYSLIKFDTFIQRSKKLYCDSQSQRNLDKLSGELQDVQRIMTRNITDVLQRGEKLSTVTQLSGKLSASAQQYASRAKYLNYQALWQKYSPIIVIFVLLMLLFFYKFYL